jgi:hypothetical protein
MGRDRDKRRKKARNLGQRTKEEEDVVRAIEAEVACRLNRVRKQSVRGNPPNDPSVFGAPDVPVRAPLKPRPNLRSGAVALPQPESEDTFSILNAGSMNV